MKFAFSVIVEGQSYSSVQNIFLWNDIVVPAEKTFYRAQKKIFLAIEQMCRENVLLNRSLMRYPSTISFDGSWSHRRGARECLLVIIDQTTKKIVDFSILLKHRPDTSFDYSGASNGMEVEGLRRLIPQWKDDPKVTAYVHDKDAKTRKALMDSGWKIREFIDPNHVSKSFDRKFSKFNEHRLLNGLKNRLHNWFTNLLRSDFTENEKTKLWMNAFNHLCGDHSQCPKHGDTEVWAKASNESARNQLSLFLDATKELLTISNSRFSTQLCECLHSLKAKFASKTISWKISWPTRVMCAILQFNHPNAWKFELYKRLNLPPLPCYVLQRLQPKFHSVDHRNSIRRCKERQMIENMKRSKSREKNKASQKGIHDYKYPVSPLPRTESQPLQQIQDFNRKLSILPRRIKPLNPFFKKLNFSGTAQDDENDSDFKDDEEDHGESDHRDADEEEDVGDHDSNDFFDPNRYDAETPGDGDIDLLDNAETPGDGDIDLLDNAEIEEETDIHVDQLPLRKIKERTWVFDFRVVSAYCVFLHELLQSHDPGY